MKSGWEVKPLGEVCAFQRGLTYSKKDEVDSGGTSVLRATNVDLETGELDLSEIRFIRSEVSVPSSKMVEPGTLLICTASGSKKHLGKTALIDRHMDFAFGGFMGLLKPDEGLLPKYLQWLMRSDDYWAFIDGLSDGANINNLKFKQLADFPIPLPPLEEQRRIVAVLDEAFEGLARARAHAEANLQNARELFESFLGAIFTRHSADWSSLPLQKLVEGDCTLSYGIVQPGDEVSGGMPIVRPTDLGRRVITLDGLKRIDATRADGYARTKLKGTEILLCVRGSTGVVSMASAALKDANVTRGIVPVRFDPQRVDQRLGYYQFLSKPVQDQIRAGTYGAALMQINIRDLRQIAFVVPPLNQQGPLIQRIESVANDFDTLADSYARKVSEIDNLRQSLLQKAFAGELT